MPTNADSPLILIAAALVLAGCSDPASNVPQTSATAPMPVPTAAGASGIEYRVRAGSTVGFTGSKVTGSHDGGFTNVVGSFQVGDGKLAGAPEITISMRSLWSDNDRLTGHLISPDFFDVAQYPVSSFTITSIEPSGESHQVNGNLNLHGVTKGISFPAQVSISPETATLKAEFAINRRDFNINYPGKPNDLIRDQVVIRLDIQATPGPERPEDRLIQ